LVAVTQLWLLVSPTQVGVAAAQETAQDVAQEPALPDTVPSAIAAAQIGSAAEAALAQLLRIRSGLAPDPGLLAIDSLLADLSTSMEQLNQESDSVLLESMSLRRIDNLLVQWRNREDQVRRWQQRLEAGSSELDAELDTLTSIREVWEVTQQSAADQQLPPAMVDALQSVLDNAGEAEAEAVLWRDELLTILGRVSQTGAEIAQSKSRVERAITSARRRILSADSPPLWQALFAPDDSLDVGQYLRGSWEDNKASLSEFARSNLQQILAHLVLFLVIAVALYGVKRSSKSWATDDDALKASTYILSRPVATAAVLALLSTRLIHPRAPTVVFDLAGFLWLIPILRLVPGVLKPSMRTSAYSLMGLFALAQIEDLLSEHALTSRIVLLLLTGLALAGLAWVLRSGGGDRIPGSGRWRKVAVFLSQLALLVLAVSLLVNVLGFVRLAFLLTRGVLTSGFAALIGLVLVEVLTGITTVVLRRGPARWLQSVRLAYGNLNRRLSRLVYLGVLLLWLVVTLEQFTMLDPVVRVLSLVITRPWTMGSWQISLLDVVAFVVTLWLTLWISRIVKVLLKEDVLPKMQLARGIPETISTLAHYAVLLIGFLIAAGAAGVDLTRITLLAGALGVGIGFGLQNVVNNFISGLILMFERPIQIGDTIDIGNASGDLRGEVKQIGIRASIVRTFDGAEVIVPNGDLISGRVTNWTLSDRLRRVELPIGVAYGTDPKLVLQVIVEAAKKHEDVLDDPEPVGLFIGFGDSSLDFLLRFWTARFDSWRRVASEIAVNMNDGLAEASITIPFPQRDLHLKSMEETVRQALTDGSNDAPDR
jgi:small-conductance mechanosensitive channel